MITVINKFGEERLKELTDLVKDVAEESYYFDKYLINVFSEMGTNQISIGQAATFVDKKVVDLKYNEAPLMTLSDIIKTRKNGSNSRPNNLQKDPLDLVLRFGPALMYAADLRMKKKIDLGGFQSAIASLGDTYYSSAYEEFCEVFEIPKKILQVPLLHLFLIANTPNYRYYLTKNCEVTKGITVALLYHEIGHSRISPITDEMSRKLNAAAVEVATPLDPFRQNYVNLFTDTIVNVASQLNGPQKEEFKIGFNACYQFDISASSINGSLPSVANLIFFDVTARLGQQKEGDCPYWVEQMFPQEYEIIRPISIKIARSLAENADLAEKMYNQKASLEDVSIFYRRLRDQSKWEQKIKFYAKTMNGFKEPSMTEREKMSPMPLPQIPLRWAFTEPVLKSRLSGDNDLDDEEGYYD